MSLKRVVKRLLEDNLNVEASFQENIGNFFIIDHILSKLDLLTKNFSKENLVAEFEKSIQFLLKKNQCTR